MFISYQWDHQEEAIRVRQFLEEVRHLYWQKTDGQADRQTLDDLALRLGGPKNVGKLPYVKLISTDNEKLFVIGTNKSL